MCPSAWSSMREFVEALAKGEGNFYDGWMKNPMSAMISCNDGFRPFSFYIEVIVQSPKQVLITRSEGVCKPVCHLAANRFPTPLHRRDLLFGNPYLIGKLLLRVPEGRTEQLQTLGRRGFRLNFLCKIRLEPFDTFFVI